jgi:hypothetical protein
MIDHELLPLTTNTQALADYVPPLGVHLEVKLTPALLMCGLSRVRRYWIVFPSVGSLWILLDKYLILLAFLDRIVSLS